MQTDFLYIQPASRELLQRGSFRTKQPLVASSMFSRSREAIGSYSNLVQTIFDKPLKDRLDCVIRDCTNAGEVPGPRYLATGKEIAIRDRELAADITVFTNTPKLPDI